MGSRTDYNERRTLAQDFASVTPFVALFTGAEPAEDGSGGVEVSGGAYTRKALTVGTPFMAGGVATIQNDQSIAFPRATASWGNVVAFAVFDAATGGNMLWHGLLTDAREIGAGTDPVIAPGQLSFTSD